MEPFKFLSFQECIQTSSVNLSSGSLVWKVWFTWGGVKSAPPSNIGFCVSVTWTKCRKWTTPQGIVGKQSKQASVAWKPGFKLAGNQTQSRISRKSLRLLLLLLRVSWYFFSSRNYCFWYAYNLKPFVKEEIMHKARKIMMFLWFHMWFAQNSNGAQTGVCTCAMIKREAAEHRMAHSTAQHPVDKLCCCVLVGRSWSHWSSWIWGSTGTPWRGWNSWISWACRSIGSFISI